LSPGSLNMNGVLPLPTTSGSVLSSCSPPICSMRSIPVQNAFSPAPVSTTQRTSSFRRRERQSVCSSRCICELNALCPSARFSVPVATPSASSYRRVSNFPTIASLRPPMPRIAGGGPYRTASKARAEPRSSVLVDHFRENDARRGLDQREVRERLRKVAEVARSVGVELLGVQTERRRDPQELLHEVAGLL